MLSVIIFVFVLGAGFILAYAWDEIGLVDDSTDRSIRKLSIGLLIIFLFTWLSPNWKEVFIENRVTTAQNIFSKK